MPHFIIWKNPCSSPPSCQTLLWRDISFEWAARVRYLWFDSAIGLIFPDNFGSLIFLLLSILGRTIRRHCNWTIGEIYYHPWCPSSPVPWPHFYYLGCSSIRVWLFCQLETLFSFVLKFDVLLSSVIIFIWALYTYPECNMSSMNVTLYWIFAFHESYAEHSWKLYTWATGTVHIIHKLQLNVYVLDLPSDVHINHVFNSEDMLDNNWPSLFKGLWWSLALLSRQSWSFPMWVEIVSSGVGWWRWELDMSLITSSLIGVFVSSRFDGCWFFTCLKNCSIFCS